MIDIDKVASTTGSMVLTKEGLDEVGNQLYSVEFPGQYSRGQLNAIGKFLFDFKNLTFTEKAGKCSAFQVFAYRSLLVEEPE